MFKKRAYGIEQMAFAFEVERASYQRTINLLRDELYKQEKEAPILSELEAESDNKVKQLEATIAKLEDENTRLKEKLSQREHSLNERQYKEYKRMKQNEYNRKWYAKKRAQAE